MMIAEFVIGRQTHLTPSRGIPVLTPNHKGWRWVGHFGVFTIFLILSLYWVISGWTTNYVYEALTGSMLTLGTDGTTVAAHFDSFVSDSLRPLVPILVFVVITIVIIIAGVRRGIEAGSKLLMPLLIVLLVGLCIYSLSLPGARQGLSYMFTPDFSKP